MTIPAGVVTDRYPQKHHNISSIKLTLGRTSKISILDTQNESSIIVGKIEPALLRNEPIVQSSTGSTNVKTGHRIQHTEEKNKISDGIVRHLNREQLNNFVTHYL